MAENSSLANATTDTGSGAVADVPLLDLSTPMVEVNHSELPSTLVNK